MKRNEFKRGVRGLSVVLLACLAPLMMGATSGCQEFQNSIVASLETATGAALDAVLTDFFGQFQSNSP